MSLVDPVVAPVARLVVDARKAQDAGIGTYVRQLVPRVLRRLRRTECTLWLAPGQEEWLTKVQADAGTPVTGHLLPARPLTLREQPVLRRALQPGQLLWATSLAHPLFWRGPLVATVHDVAQLALPPALIGGRLARLGARVHLESLRRCASELMFVSQFSRDEFARLVGSPRQRSTVTPEGVDPHWFEARSVGDRPQARPYFVSVSSVRPHKNFAFLLRAFAAVADQLPHDLVIVGALQGSRTADSALPQELARLGGRARLLGRLADHDLRRWVAHADAMVFPSLYEGFGLPPLEALAAGCPVLCSTAAALREVCGEAATYFDPRDEVSLQQCLLAHAAAGPDAREGRIARGQAHARTFDWESAADLTASVLERALQEQVR